MTWPAERERELIRGIGPVLLRRFSDLVDDWMAGWHASSPGNLEPPDLPAVTRAAVERGVDEALELQEEMAAGLVAGGVPLDAVVSAVLSWEHAVVRRLARDGVEDIFSGAAAINRLTHQLIILVAEGYRDAVHRERDEARRGLLEADRLKIELISLISHDLKTPLTTIEGCAHSMLLVEDLDPAQRRRFSELILHNAERLGRLISQIVDLSRIESGTFELAVEPIDLDAVLRLVAESVHPSRPVHLSIPAQLPVVQADRDAVERIVVNLIDNAMRFSPAGQAVTVEASAEKDAVEVRVRDTGPGVPEDRREGLFSKFYQVDPSLSARRSGTGLGLAIVRGLAESLGGAVGYTPNVPTGSVFWFRVPRADGFASAPAAHAPGSDHPDEVRRA